MKQDDWLRDKAFFEFAIDSGYLSEEKRILIEFYRASKGRARKFFFDLITSLPRVCD